MGATPSSSPLQALRSQRLMTQVVQEVIQAALAAATVAYGRQSDAAARLGVTRTYLNALVNGDRPVGRSMIARLPALGVPTDTTSWLDGLLSGPREDRKSASVEPVERPEERVEELRSAYERQFMQPPENPRRGAATPLARIPDTASQLVAGLAAGERRRSEMCVRALLLRSYAQTLLGQHLDALCCALCAERIGRGALYGPEQRFALARAAIARSQAYCALGLWDQHRAACGDVLKASADTPAAISAGLPNAGERGLLAGIVHMRRFTMSEVWRSLSAIEQHVARGHCHAGDEGLELLLSYPLAIHAALARENRLNLRKAEGLCARGLALLNENRTGLGPVPQILFLQAQAAVLQRTGDPGGRRAVLEEVRAMAVRAALPGRQAQAEALLAE